MQTTFQLKTRTASVSYNSENEKQDANTRLQLLAERAGRTFSSFKDVFEHCLHNAISENTLENNENTVENNESILKTESENKVQTLVNEAIALIGYDENEIPTLEKVLIDLIEIVKTPLEPVEPVEIIKTVERKLDENEVLILFSPAQTKILQTIARWRSRQKLDESVKTQAEIITEMIFNRTVLTNDHGAFETGIRFNKLNGKLETK